MMYTVYISRKVKEQIMITLTSIMNNGKVEIVEYDDYLDALHVFDTTSVRSCDQLVLNYDGVVIKTK